MNYAEDGENQNKSFSSVAPDTSVENFMDKNRGKYRGRGLDTCG